MGLVFSAASMACCCTASAVGLCCSCCPSCKNSTSSRIMYALVLLLTMIVSCIFLAPGLQSALQKMPFCKSNTTDAQNNNILTSVLAGETESYKIDCSNFVGYMSVYRICFIVTLFFLLFMVMMLGVRKSSDPRAGIQNGFWGIKFLVIVGGIIGAFFIPENSSFGEVWMYFGFIGAFLFILIQLVLIVDFAHSWAEAWVGNYEETDAKVSKFVTSNLMTSH